MLIQINYHQQRTNFLILSHLVQHRTIIYVYCNIFMTTVITDANFFSVAETLLTKGFVNIGGKTVVIKRYEGLNALIPDEAITSDSSRQDNQDSDEKSPQVLKTSDSDFNESNIAEIVVSNIPPDMKRETFLTLFESKRIGGGDIEHSNFTDGDSSAVIRFKESAGNIYISNNL